MSEHTRIRTADGMSLSSYEWIAKDPVITVGLLHGYAEHCGRYRHVAEAFNARGISLLGVDLRGHGHSEGLRGHISSFADYHHDVEALLGRMRDRSGGGPLALLGHSMGGLLVCHWMLEQPARGAHGDRLQGDAHGPVQGEHERREADLACVACSSPIFEVAVRANPLKVAAGRVVSRLLPTVSLPSGLHGNDVCRDAAIARAYDQDPLVFPTVNSRWFTEATAAMDSVVARAGQLTRPILILYGGEDRIARADRTDVFAKALTMQDRVVSRLPGHYHEIFNEPPEHRTKIIDRFAQWFVAHGKKD